jgi:hypothetical protein
MLVAGGGDGALEVGLGRNVTTGGDDVMLEEDVILVETEGFSRGGAESQAASMAAPTAPRKTRRLTRRPLPTRPRLVADSSPRLPAMWSCSGFILPSSRAS